MNLALKTNPAAKVAPSGSELRVVPDLPCFDMHVLKKVLRIESDANDEIPLTDKQIDSDVLEYLEFLRNHKLSPNEVIVPPVRVDRVWHIHILQTRQYAEVCEEYFGHFLHHASMICGAGQEVVHPWDHRG